MVLREKLRVVGNQLHSLRHLTQRIGTKFSSGKTKRNYMAGALSVLAAALGLFGLQSLATPSGGRSAATLSQNLNSTPEPADSTNDDNSQSASNLSSSTSASITDSSESDNNFSAQVNVNGQDIPVPDNGSVHKTVTSDGVTTKVDVTVNNSGDSSNRTRQRVRLNTHTSTSISSSESSTSSGGTD